MTKKQYIAAHKATIEEASRRMRELRKAGEHTPALKMLESDFTKKARSVRFNAHMTKDELKQAVSYAQRFVNAKSSTVKGMDDIRITRDKSLRDVIKDYDKSGLTRKRTELYELLQTEEFKRAKGMNFDSNIIVAYFNRQLKHSFDTVEDLHDDLIKLFQETSDNKIADPNAYMREKFNI